MGKGRSIGEDRSQEELALGRRLRSVVGWHVGMVGVSIEADGEQYPAGPLEDVATVDASAIPDVRDAGTLRVLLDLVRRVRGDPTLRVEVASCARVLVGARGIVGRAVGEAELLLRAFEEAQTNRTEDHDDDP